MRRSQKDFDDWFKLGDPWGYHTDTVQIRLLKSLAFIKKQVPLSFDGCFVEFGSFNGDFTVLLAKNYPNATVYASDISEFALQGVRNKTSVFKNVQHILSDMLSFPSKKVAHSSGVIIILMESLYYMPRPEQVLFLEKIHSDFPESWIFFSAPVIGEEFYREREIIQMFSDAKYSCSELLGLNFKRTVRFSIFFYFAVNYFSFLRNSLCFQVIYLFKPRKK